jgi:hypothetical protein
MANFDDDFGTYFSAIAIAALIAGAVYAGALYLEKRSVETASALPSIERLLPNGVPVPQ